MLQSLIEIYVPLEVPVLQARDADIKNHRARFYPATRNQSRFPNGNGQYVGTLDIGF